MNPRIENLLQISADTSEDIRQQVPDMDAGFDDSDRTWEIIVKTAGSLDRIRSIYTNAEFTQLLNIISLERHLKVLGIFRRLYMRDGKDSYLQHLPRVLAYTQKESLCDPNLFYLSVFLDKYFKDI